MKTVYFNAKIYVERDHFEDTLVVEDGIITDVGTYDQFKTLTNVPDVTVINCQGQTMIPGLNDSHLHFMQTAEVLNQVDIEGVPSIDEMIARCKAFIHDHPDRVRNGLHAIGWNQDLFEDNDRMPNRYDLDAISTDIPIVLERICGHIVSSNSKVLELLEAQHGADFFADSNFVKDDHGNLLGIYTEHACIHAKDFIPDFTMAERREMIIDTMHRAVALGLTSVQSNDVGTTFSDAPAAFALFKDIYAKGEAPLRYRHQVCFNQVEDFEDYIATEWSCGDYPKDSWLQLGPLKLFRDGSLGARTALMRDDYLDDPGNHGLEWVSVPTMTSFCKMAAEHGIQVITHVIGDKAIEDTVNVYAATFESKDNPYRHTLVHCQITDRPLLERIAKLNIGVMAQPIFLDYDMKIVENRCGKDLAATSYAFKSLKELGAHVAYGTDCPVESFDPFMNLYMAVTRQNKKGEPKGGFYPQECVDIYDAIDAYTYESAYLEFEEERKGRLKPGYYADFVLLDQDIFAIDTNAIKDVRPTLTVVGGKEVYKK
ncbi:amidohydrolase family protein [Peptoniphilus equinus]|uniref:Amidohydrolase family protein n=1 Tax=Peptoniphilus equinus TaxID=3016343 RepID=A0ABY7QV17_9FIRM|nr:amidohydrolase family protein [Peptoniphilus equinus]WBW50632.1 amidohydrolase family protein [Peptoniphilus equinus]